MVSLLILLLTCGFLIFLELKDTNKKLDRVVDHLSDIESKAQKLDIVVDNLRAIQREVTRID
jgi:hypothetical protein